MYAKLRAFLDFARRTRKAWAASYAVAMTFVVGALSDQLGSGVVEPLIAVTVMVIGTFTGVWYVRNDGTVKLEDRAVTLPPEYLVKTYTADDERTVAEALVKGVTTVPQYRTMSGEFVSCPLCYEAHKRSGSKSTHIVVGQLAKGAAPRYSCWKCGTGILSLDLNFLSGEWVDPIHPREVSGE